MTTPLLASNSAIADADGIATVVIGPTKYRERWTVRNTAVQNSDPTDPCKCTVYRNIVSPSTQIEVSQYGGEDNSDTVHSIGEGEHLIYQWTDAVPGSTCQVIVTGDIEWGR